MALECGITVTYRRPCRKAPRCFKASDVARIAGKAVSCGESPMIVAAVVLHRLGFGPTICGVVTIGRVALIMVKVLKDVGLTVAMAQALRALIQWLLRSPLAKVPKFNLYLAAAIIAVSALDGILDAVEGIIEEIDTFIDAFDVASELCELTKKGGG